MSLLYRILLLCVVSLNALQLQSPPNLPRVLHTRVRTMAIRDIISVRCCDVVPVPKCAPTDNIYLELDSGMRISRIVRVSTTSYDAMLKLGLAKSRLEIMKICLVRHKKTTVLSEHHQLPMSVDGIHAGWRFEQRHGSPIRACSGTPGSVLWVADLHSNECELSVGSWLVGTVSLHGKNQITAFFTKSISRRGEGLQQIELIRPHFSRPVLVREDAGLQWVITFIELQHCDELGLATRRGVGL